MKIPVLFIFVLILITGVNAQQRKIYLAPDDHTDYMWSGDEETYRAAFLEMLDYYVRLNDSTSGNPYELRSKWNCDGSYWVYEYEKNRTPEQFSRLMEQVKAGSITVPLNSLPELSGIAPAEAVIRDMYYAGSLERRYGLDLDLVIDMEDQVLPLGLSSLWAGAGAKYSWRGVCDCATKVTGLHSRPHEIYWYKGLDDQRILMKWYSLGQNNQELGGYAEARDPMKSFRLCLELMKSDRYPYKIAGAFGKGWDDLKTTSDEFVKLAGLLRYNDTKVIVSNEIDFFRDFEHEYGESLPSETVSYGSTEWGNSLASLAAVSADMKRSVERLRTAEGLYTLVALKNSKFASDLSTLRERAWIACGLYFDHDWTADSPILTKKQRAAWARKIKGEFKAYVDTLLDLSSTALGEMIEKPDGCSEAFYVFNPLGWSRTDYCDYPVSEPSNVHVVDMTTMNEVPFQYIKQNGNNFLRILASDVPSLGFRIYGICRGEPHHSLQPAASVTGGTIRNEHYTVTLSTDGAIQSLTGGRMGDHEYIRPTGNLYANDLGPAPVKIPGSRFTVENAGPISVTLTADSEVPMRHTSRITLFRFSDRIEIENSIRQNIGTGPVTYAFSFNLDRPEIHNEEAGAILLARQQTDNGHYADSICRLDWLALNHFTDVSDQNAGITISNSDAFLMQTGNSTIDRLDPHTNLIRILAAGQVDAPSLGIVNQDGDSYFQNNFALFIHDGSFDAASSMRFSLEHQNPLMAGKVTGKTGSYGKSFSLFTLNNPRVLVWAVKPAEEGIDRGIILRVWNMSEKDEDFTVSSESAIDKGNLTTHIEKDLSEIKAESGILNLKNGHNRLHTYRIFLK